MARLAISKDYFPAYARLPRKAQRKADEFLRKFEHDSTSTAIHLEPIKRTLDSQLRSARIGDDYRVILRAPEKGDVFLVLWADHHDEAYRWAVTKQTAVHPLTGALQIFDVSEAIEAITTLAPTSEAIEAADLFQKNTDDEIFLAGVPRVLLPSVRAVVTDDDLDRLLPHLPPEAGEVLTALAAGISLDEALEEVLGRKPALAAAPQPLPIDITDVPAALARESTQRQFRMLEAGLDLDAALKHPLDVWRVFLHPRQRQLARARTKGPTRVLGGAGTGKTVVALHRTAFLVREVFTKPDDRVLFTTFTVNLAQDLKAQLVKLLEPDELARVEVVNIDSWAASFLRNRGVSVRVAFEDDKERRQHFDSAYEVYGRDEIPIDFYRMEWREVIQEQGLQTEDEYVRAVRKSRGVRLGRAERRRLWPVFAAYRDNLAHAGMMERLDVLRRARVELEKEGAPPRYRSVVVDETQDFSADGLRLLRAIAGPERSDDLFLVGDAHQRIYGKPVALSQCGIQIRGRRSQTLRINYRTTGAICRWSMAVLKDVAIDDLDDGKADQRGYVSLREGPSPIVRGCTSVLEEERAVVETVKGLLDADVPAESICIVARTKGPLVDRFAPALQRVDVGSVLLEQDEPRLPGIRLATMHRVKGLEFAVVLLVGVSKNEVPFPSPELRSDDAVMSAQTLLRERSLLYVAASRARDVMHVFYAGAPSALLAASTNVQVPSRPARRPTTPPVVADVDRLAAVLATPLVELEVPTRLLNWARGENVTTLGDLARTSPSDLMAQANLGRTSVRKARELLEILTGRRWESLVGTPETSVALAPVISSLKAWDSLREAFNDEHRALVLENIPLPTRVRTFAVREKLKTLGDLARLSRAQLAEAPNIARASLKELPLVISGYLDALSKASSLADEGLLECFKIVVEGLDSTLRIIAVRRSGLGSEPVTLKEIADTFGVTRERIRQLEGKLCEQLRRQPWAVEARRRVDIATLNGPVPLDTLATDPWWTAASEAASVVDFILEHVLETDLTVVEIDDRKWVSRFKAEVLSRAFSQMENDAKQVKLPAALVAFEPIVQAHAKPFGPHVAAHFFEELKGRLILENDRVMAVGDSRGARVLSILRAAHEPLHVDEVQRQLGGRVGKFPDEVLHFRRGYVGLRHHFPDFEQWQKELVPAAVRIVEELGPERQWYCGELLDELREDHDIPEWLTPFGLGALIKASDALRYLGRLRVALPSTQETERRVYVHEAAEQLLLDAGEPLSDEELLSKLNERLGMSEHGAMVFMRPQFVRIDADHIGLLSRDVPGGAAAIAEAGAHIEGVLARRGRGLSDFHVHEQIVGLSQDHTLWSRQLAMSVLRSDGRFRLSQSGAVGLATWESTGVPTRLELVRGAIDDSGGRVSIDAVMARIEAHYGERPSRVALLGLALPVGRVQDGDWLVRRSQK
jgi:superfamily I DNA/RNA helicase/mRNA-degrading endonuclease RelE of RelBE toxin-antitoxin system